MNRTVEIDTGRIVDWESFHDAFAEAFGFPSWYGRNMDAWIDCMTSLDEPRDGLTSVHAHPDGMVILSLSDATALAERCVDIYDAIVECSAFVNFRKAEAGENAVLALSFWKQPRA